MKNKKAAALSYEKGYDAPVVTAAGMGYVADKIVEKAQDNNVPIVYDEELAALLTNVDLGDEIPYELYDAVAKVIAYVMDIDELIDRR
ncbi:flagellar biosynthesis protein [Clostridium tetanomorphum]|uniref:Flagellar biogenesis protein n=1 Tax=Clostridium tetanomorphum TaxID=1553 RepID=A0A923ECQ3_CLOTT|nr:EscU/YscU/HrcU family type III secretion system export apparatus switch protein [Clostridium tetanomorphum]KAJ49338.1 flagellar biosynthesis related protein [Clostridium tetanomorphum DSM 665]KAJ53233.1 flagellar biosynthesis related protein [Clostridium tetanomorphum DSM 665]MBC2399456.1 flagellar biogenesis protein [Clostridium tetanomorphum]MBP1865736.1 flagellar biosynthesis protein [Clostridium tetanomorphum]NRS86856.1 flagellar biosynthesis protein [Clostridium tetanomorphum]